MEKNLPGDNLEKFLQNAFGQFEGEPSNTMWDRIEAQLPPVPRLWYASWPAWAAGAAAAVLIGMLVFQQFRHTARVERLAADLECARMEMAGLKEQLASFPSEVQDIVPNDLITIQPGRLPSVKAFTPLPGMDEPAPLREERVVNPGSPAFSALPIPMKPIFPPNPNLSVAALPTPVFSSASPPKWVLGAWAGAGNTSFTGKTQPDPGPGHHEPVRPAGKEMVSRSQSVMAGLSLRHDLEKNWFVETGLQYRKFDFQYTHQPDLKFGERKPHGNPHQEDTHEFGYYLNSPSGTMYVSLSAEQTNPNENISNQENLQVEITTNEKIELLSIPAAVGYQIGKGRMTGQLKAGLLANIGLSHHLDVSGVNFRNQRFRPHNQNGVRIESSRLIPVSFDYFLAAGLAYDITPSWQLNLMPSVSGSLTNKIDALFQDPSDFTVGLTAGLGYRF